MSMTTLIDAYGDVVANAHFVLHYCPNVFYSLSKTIF
jgi:hypothetical protein